MSSAHESARAPPARPSRGHQPSFSAALLDAIYQSLEADADARSSTETRPAPASPPQRTPVSSRHGHRATSAVSSPSRSSVRSPRLQRPPRPCRVRPDPQPNSLLLPPPPPPPHEPTGDRADQKKKGRKSKRNAKKTKVAPFACLLNALLCNRRPATRSVEHTPRATAAAFAAPEPASARSILSSRASRRESMATGGILTPARRAVRFSPVAVVVDDDRGGGGAVVGTATRLRDAAEMETMVQAKESAAEAERRVEELLRALGVAEERERERAKESSESSSDLFELESLPAALDDAEPPRPRASAAARLLARPRPRPRPRVVRDSSPS
ncbi:hypothetical protein SEVIR_1G344800v4 [Setaria viridis]|uniref:Uncharacterized protein n=1 Tax=Setaria viridis TaxID=4556 RepID=A0A4U6WIX5_SETVI|nr:protein BIG GRAIN 1-like [Setaria viridis]TKW41853.1 hypothetical protein SEVIR_1G344800v2 [Setaria viridis]